VISTVDATPRGDSSFGYKSFGFCTSPLSFVLSLLGVYAFALVALLGDCLTVAGDGFRLGTFRPGAPGAPGARDFTGPTRSHRELPDRDHQGSAASHREGSAASHRVRALGSQEPGERGPSRGRERHHPFQSDTGPGVTPGGWRRGDRGASGHSKLTDHQFAGKDPNCGCRRP